MSIPEKWKFPADVRGWLTEPEGRLLADYAEAKHCLEIGAYAGRSTICMAQVAASLHVIDPLDGRATREPCDLSREIVANMHRYGVGACIHAGTTEEIAPDLPDRAFQFIFIDGDHSQAAVRKDIEEALRVLAPGGLLAFHDYESLQDPAVTVEVNRLVRSGGKIIDRAGVLVIVRPAEGQKYAKPVVALAMPRRGPSVSFGASEGFHLAPTFGGCTVVRIWTDSSILDHCFNRCWTTALNIRKKGITHFAMIHDDICPQYGWLDMLLREMERLQADIVSAVVRIKCDLGTTSTAVESDDPWYPRRLTMKEIDKLPVTFGDDDVAGELLLNTGLWICDLRKPWVDNPGPMTFQTLSRIVEKDAGGRPLLDCNGEPVYLDEGELEAQVRSEDWEFSREARRRGAKLFATKGIEVNHDGYKQFSNRELIGWETDEFNRERQEAMRGAAECVTVLN
jgi:hypothetical protein